MRYFIVHLECQDGEHSHNYKYAAKGTTKAAVRKRIESQQLYEFGQNKPNAMCSFGDGLTAVTRYSLTEIPDYEFVFLTSPRNGHQVMYEV